MKKKENLGLPKSREELASPFSQYSIKDRLVMSNAVDLRNNHTIEKRGKYQTIKPIDSNKKFK